MTPKDKAKELIVNFSDVGLITSIEAKQCALIAVDEIINSNPCYEDSDRGGNFQWNDNTYYWGEVKDELIKL
jgi:hypothetical protein